MYTYIHNYILQFISTCTDYEFKPCVTEFTTYYFSNFHGFILNEKYDDEYVKKLLNCDMSKKLILLSNEYRNIDNFACNVVMKFLDKYVYVKLIECENCKSAVDCNDTECYVCGYFIKTITYRETSNNTNNNTKDCYSNNGGSCQLPCQFKNKKHNPAKHCYMWLLQLQGKESITISCEETQLILNVAQSKYVKHDGNIEFTCDVIRSYLKKLRLTRLNPNVTHLRRLIEKYLNITHNEAYYDLTEEEILEIMRIFNLIQVKYDQLCTNPKVLSRIYKERVHNNLYYPYYLIQVLKYIIHNKQRLKFILSNIHVQSDKTTFKNDMIWAMMQLPL